MNQFKNPLDPENIKIKTALRQWVITELKLKNSIDININEHSCTEPNCVYAETLICVGDTEGGTLYKITKPLVFIRKVDVSSMALIKNSQSGHRH